MGERGRNRSNFALGACRAGVPDGSRSTEGHQLVVFSVSMLLLNMVLWAALNENKKGSESRPASQLASQQSWYLLRPHMKIV